ncbi:uncharacterized protein LOC133913411 [Phragmites australis]|uniref:uncharacterized protein LOC133913411 n=1 Tax=Phragmites australis TaxID=29695 RepID=UPI002D78B7E0|nr:uncharacterized protein LOC133913411 [Phragmites australis]
MTDLEPRKIFVGGLPRSVVTPDGLRAHFARYGEVVDAVAMVNPENGLGRGFGFVEFADEAAVLRTLDSRERDMHVFNGRKVEVKRAQTRSVRTRPTSYSPNADLKIFVGGLRDNVTEDDLTNYFQNFGAITDVVVMYDRITRRTRGFGFVTFDSHEAVNKVLESRFHDLNGTKVETKKAEPREHAQCQNEHYHGSMTANRYSGMYSLHNISYLVHNGHYFVPAYPCIYAPHGTVNYGYMMNQMATSNDTGMMVMQGSPMIYADYGRYPMTMSTNYLGHTDLNLGSGSKTNQVKGNRQRVDIHTSAGIKSDPVKPDSSNLL